MHEAIGYDYDGAISVLHTIGPGQPRKIPLEDYQQVKELVDEARLGKANWGQIAARLQISTKTLERWRKENNYEDPRRTIISDHELHERMRLLTDGQPDVGEVGIESLLATENIFIPRSRLRAAIAQMDEEGLQHRKQTARIQRRVYNVAGPHHLWHIDGWHKLIDYHFVVHAGIDGFSRTVTFLHCSDNNRAATVLEQFKVAVTRYGCPSRVRADKGGENRDVALFMIKNRGVDRNSIMLGRSVHNQRIERFWRDMRRSCLNLYKKFFLHLQNDYFFDFANEYVVFCIHYLFLNRINADLERYRDAWNNHKLSTEHNRTPHELLRFIKMLQSIFSYYLTLL
jgi:hypothetical protein